MRINFCGVCGKPSSNGLCGPCLIEWQINQSDIGKDKLKVFRINVWELNSSTGRKNGELLDTLVMLATDDDYAHNVVLTNFLQSGYEEDNMDLEIVELVGPFTNGFILSSLMD